MAITANTFLDRAKPLQERGFSLIPLKPRDKAPIFGVRSRTTNPELIAAWAEQYPDANVGVCADENFVILDLDDVAAAERSLNTKQFWLGNYTVQSSPGKAHVYFRRNGFEIRNLELGAVGSLRAFNMFVVGAGSVHPKT